MVVTSQMTLEEFAALPDDGTKQELDRGEVKVMAPAQFRHGWIVEKLRRSLSEAVYGGNLGILIAEIGFLLSEDPAIVRAPDLAFVRHDRVPTEPADEYFRGAPDLAIEVVSPNDRAIELREKVRQYLDAGAAEVWVLYPNVQQVEVWGPERRDLNADDTLASEDLFPGWSVPVVELF